MGLPTVAAAHSGRERELKVNQIKGLFLLLLLLFASGCSTPQTRPLQTPEENSDSSLQEGECETHTASMTLSATVASPEVGEVVTITAALANEGCVGLGIPQYRLYVQSDEPQPTFDPSDPEPVAHYLEIAPGESDKAEFVLQAVRPGEATLRGSASFEVHLGYPGPAYWGSSSSGPLVITVMP